MARVTKEYGACGRAGCIQIRIARTTGLPVGVYNGEQAGLCTANGTEPWSTMCEEHGYVISHPTLQQALYHSADPGGWCEVCMKNARENDNG